MRFKGLLYITFAVIIFVVIVDQATKNLVLANIGIGGQPIIVIERFFYIVCHRNSGAAWGILKNGRMFFLVMTPVLIIGMCVLLVRNKDMLLRFALSFIIGGAIGNYIDRLFVGSVVDFLDFYIFNYNFPTFNAADSSIVLGAALLIIYSLLTGKKKGDGRDSSDSADNL